MSNKAHNYLLLWLDAQIDLNKCTQRPEYIVFHDVIKDIQVFRDEHACRSFIEHFTGRKKICLVVAGSVGEWVVPRVHDFPHIDSIIVFCGNKTRHEQWAKSWSKVKGVVTEPNSVVSLLGKIVQRPAASSSPPPAKHNKQLDQLQPSFMYTQLLKEILLTIRFNKRHIDHFTNYCRQKFSGNEHELDNIQRFEEEHEAHPPVWWYTCDCFLPRVVNEALQSMDTFALLSMASFIADLHRHIARLHAEQIAKHQLKHHFDAFYGQGMSKAELSEFKHKQGGLVAFNRFLSVERDQQSALKTAYREVESTNLIPVLFILKIDPSLRTVPFASVAKHSYYNNYDDVLFSMNAVFRIQKVMPLDPSGRVIAIVMALTDDTDEKLHEQTNRWRDELKACSDGWEKLERLVTKMNPSNAAKNLLSILAQQSNGHVDYERMGAEKFQQGDYTGALSFYEKALAHDRQPDSPNPAQRAVDYRNLGRVHHAMKHFPEALKCYEKALKIRQRVSSPNDQALASLYSDIGDVHRSMGKYQEALSAHEKALVIEQQTLDADHSDLAARQKTIDNIRKHLQ